MKSVAFIPELLAINDNLRVAHWQANTATNDHKTLGDLYERWADLTDTLAELALGKLGPSAPDAIPAATISLTGKVSVSLLLTETMPAFLAEIRGQCEQGPDDDALNLVADLSAALNKARYLLKL